MKFNLNGIVSSEGGYGVWLKSAFSNQCFDLCFGDDLIPMVVYLLLMRLNYNNIEIRSHLLLQ